ncbi:hypothetical protein [Sphingomonas bacterium]|uniref:hypothetical protein n=1 Tax=Sphingomonas bacterium TaxID=1895847 RepID=UPI001575FFD5|nr:hypothetical protein [Sphingomonas bacterium]
MRAALILAGAGALSRFLFRYFETRWQIVVFWGVVLAYHGVRRLVGLRFSAASAILDAGCVALAIIAMKVAIEGRL